MNSRQTLGASIIKGMLIGASIVSIALFVAPSAALGQVSGLPATYDFTADFNQGALVNVSDDLANQLELIEVGEAFDFIWVAASGRGTIVRIDTLTGAVIGEYWSSPGGMGRNPSRTTVDANGNVWAGNRAEASYYAGAQRGSAVHIGLEENGQCSDRNGNGVIDTSSGLGNILPWTNAAGADTGGGVTTAADECIIHFVRTAGTNVRSVAVDANNDVWIGGFGNKIHELYDSNGVLVPGSTFNLGCGGYGALIDSNGILWSANLYPQLLRYDPSASSGACLQLSRYSYGLGIDSTGNIWNSNWSNNTVTKHLPDGSVAGVFNTGGPSGDRGVVVTPDDNVWIANSGGSTVTRLSDTGAYVTQITVGSMPTGLAVDAEGKVWVTNYSSHTVMRIDPATNSVDLTVSLGSGAYPYNYSDMTGSTLTAPPDTGTWTVVHDSLAFDQEWGRLSWDADLCLDESGITVTAASSTDGITFGPPATAAQGVDISVADGQFLEVAVQFDRCSDGTSPVLYSLTIEAANYPPAALCADVEVEAEDQCGSVASVDDGSYDPDNDDVLVTLDPTPPYPFGDTTVTLTIEDIFGETDSCEGTVTVVDTTPPEAYCNSPDTIIPPDAPIAFTAGVADYCEATVRIEDYNCWAINGAGKVISKLESCEVAIDGNTLTIEDSGGIGDHIDWFVVATDASGNTTELTCSLEVVKKPKK